MESVSERLKPESRSCGPSRILPVLALLFLLLGADSAFAITRATVLARAQTWIDKKVPYSQSRYYGGYRTDCSGFTSMSWQTTSNGHAISYSTRSLHTVSSRLVSATRPLAEAIPIAAKNLKPGDAMIKYNYHARVFYGWADAAHTKYVAYEQTGPTTKSSIKDLAADLAYGYVPYRLDRITDGLPAWNLVVNPTFDVWASGSPVWWQSSEGWGQSVWTQSVAIKRSGHNALALGNPYGRTRDVVEVSQTASVTAGLPYTLSAWACTPADPAGLVLRLRFVDSSGNTILTTSTTGAAWSIDTTPTFGKMSITATAPALTASATVSIRLAGGTDASGTVGTMAYIDDVSLYDSSPVAVSIASSAVSVRRDHSVTLSGRVTAPMPLGTVRIYVIRPGSSKQVRLEDRPLSGGAWSRTVTPGLRGKYTFTAKYLGYGPWGPVTSKKIVLTVN